MGFGWGPVAGAVAGSLIRGKASGAEKATSAQLKMAKELFAQMMSSIDQSRGAGLFDAAQIRAHTMANVESLLRGIEARGAASGAKMGDTKYSENIARGAVQGGQFLESTGQMALDRELGALSQAASVLHGNQAATNAYAAASSAASQQNAQRAGQIASLIFRGTQSGGGPWSETYPTGLPNTSIPNAPVFGSQNTSGLQYLDTSNFNFKKY